MTMQAISSWFPGLGEKMPHRQDFACSAPRPNLALKMPTPHGLKRSRSGAVETLSSAPSWNQYSFCGYDCPPPVKRIKAEGVPVSRREEQAVPAAQEHVPVGSKCPLLPAPKASGDAVSSSPSQQVAVDPGAPLSRPATTSGGAIGSSLCQQDASSHVASASPSTHYSSHDQSSSSNSHSSKASTQMSPAYRLKLQDKIQLEFNLKILKKHEELRLIEQEQAKAQIALEQLRRCHLIPYPGQPGSTRSQDEVISGTGPALAPRSDQTRPPQPAAWSVTDGPYAKHYAKWLIPDSHFDSESRSRHQRHSTVDQAESKLRGAETASSHRRQRHSTGGKTEVVHADRSQATPKQKPESTPQIMRRSDGKWVQLVCGRCGQSAFRSVQGFLNHMRIEHEVRLRSHAQAATDYGVEVDGPTASIQQSNAQSSLGAVASSKQSPDRAHPLNTTAVGRPKRSSQSLGKSAVSNPSMNELIQFSPLNPGFKRDKPKLDTDGAVPSASVPRLSALMRRAGGSQDMQQLYAQASKKEDLDAIQPLIPDDEVEEDTPVQGGPDWRKPTSQTQRNARAPQASRAPVSGVRVHSKPPSIVVPSTQGAMSMLSGTAVDQGWSSSPHGSHADYAPSPMTFVSNQDTQMNDLSPHANPPGLVTDHEDDDDMEDEARSVVEHPSASQQNVQIFNENADHPMTDIPTEAKDPVQHCQPPGAFHQQPMLMSPTSGSGEKKRRGRPSKKGKEKATK